MVVRSDRAKRKKQRGTGGGWGGKKKHRGSGSRGGHGFAGSLGHNRTWVEQNFPGHIGKKGFTRPDKTRVEIVPINIGDLERLAAGKNEVNLTQLGYNKLLSKGIVGKALKVTVASYSPRAKEKLEKSGGQIKE